MWFNTALLIIMIICFVTDVKRRKIYNIVIFPGLFVAFISHLILGGWVDFVHSFFGFLVGLGILLIPYFLGGMGAGDVKLLALIGALKGVMFVLYASVYMGIFGAVVGLLFVIWRLGPFTFFKSMLYYFSLLKCGVRTSFPLSKSSLSVTFPYGVAITGGAIICLIGEARGLL